MAAMGWLTLVVGFLMIMRMVEGAEMPKEPITVAELEALLKDGRRHLFVKFYAPWCGHCKSLAPTWEKLTEIYEAEFRDVNILKLDADAEKEAGKKFGVQGFPTLIYFPKKWTAGQEMKYEGGRSLEALVEFVNGKTGSMRLPDGSVKGRVPRVEALLREVGCKGLDVKGCAKKMIEHLKEHDVDWKFAAPHAWEQKYINYYSNVLKRINEDTKSSDWIKTELARLAGVIEKHMKNLGKEDAYYFKGRHAILEELDIIFKEVEDKEHPVSKAGRDEL